MLTAPIPVAEAPAAPTWTELPPVLLAGLVLAALSWLAARGLRRPSVAEVLRESGVSRARAYEVRAAILDLLPSILRPVGRPLREASTSPNPDRSARQLELALEVNHYLRTHPGAAEEGPRRQRYTDPFRRFVLELRERYQDVANEEFARAVAIPLRTLSDWTLAGLGEIASEPAPELAPQAEPARLQRIESVLSAWGTWRGSFVGFCAHVQEHLRIPYGRTLVARILKEHGVRLPRRRPGRSPDERALRKQFEIFFPGAQWSADGTPLSVDVAGERFTFNLELVVDPASDALLGLSVRDEEDGRAVVEAFARLCLDDPEGHQRAAIGRYPLDRVVEGVAVFEGKRAAGALPPGVDARYLLGIVRNLAQEDEGVHVAEALWRARLHARDEILVGLDHQRAGAVRAASDSLDLVCRLVDQAMASSRTLDRSFWLRALADVVSAEPEEQRHPLFRVAARRVHATYRVPHRERLVAVRRLAAMLLPLA